LNTHPPSEQRAARGSGGLRKIIGWTADTLTSLFKKFVLNPERLVFFGHKPNALSNLTTLLQQFF
jgi:hypothetical protein